MDVRRGLRQSGGMLGTFTIITLCVVEIIV